MWCHASFESLLLYRLELENSSIVGRYKKSETPFIQRNDNQLKGWVFRGLRDVKAVRILIKIRKLILLVLFFKEFFLNASVIVLSQPLNIIKKDFNRKLGLVKSLFYNIYSSC